MNVSIEELERKFRAADALAQGGDAQARSDAKVMADEIRRRQSGDSPAASPAAAPAADEPMDWGMTAKMFGAEASAELLDDVSAAYTNLDVLWPGINEKIDSIASKHPVLSVQRDLLDAQLNNVKYSNGLPVERSEQFDTTPDTPWDERWDAFLGANAEHRKFSLEETERFEQEQPGVALMARMGGALLPGSIAAKVGTKAYKGARAAEEGATRAQALMKASRSSAATAGAEGLVYGYGKGDNRNAEGTSANPVVDEMIKWGLIGTGLGFGMPVAGAGFMQTAAKTKNIAHKAKVLYKQGYDLHGVNRIVDKMQFKVSKLMADSPELTRAEATTQARESLDLSVKQVEDSLEVSGRQLEDMTPDAAAAQETYINNSIQKYYGEKRAAQSKFKNYVDDTVVGVRNAASKVKMPETKMATTLDKWSGALHTRIKKESPEIAAKLREHDFTVAKQVQRLNDKVEGFTVGWQKHWKPEGIHEEVDRLLLNGDKAGARALIKQYGTEDMVKGFDNIKEVTDELGKQINDLIPDKAHHLDLSPENFYFPSRVNSYDDLVERWGKGDKKQGTLGYAYKQYAKRYNKDAADLTEREKQRVAGEFLRQRGMGNGNGQAGYTKKKTRGNITAEDQDLYMGSAEAMTNYIRRVTEDTAERRMFGQNMKGGNAATEMDFDDETFRGLMAGLDTEGMNTQLVQEMLRARFTTGKVGPNKAIQHVKNIGIAGALGQFKSAAIQIADVGHSAYVNGLRNTAEGFLQNIKKDGASVGDIGLKDVIAEDLNTSGKTAALVRNALKYTGFRLTDRMGKQTFMNAAMKKNKQMLKNSGAKNRAGNSFNDKWDDIFTNPEDMAEFKKALADEDFTNEKVQLMLWHDLADVQPISLSEMPQKYLEMPNGRLIYTLKSFALKQLDIMRRDIVGQVQKGNKREAARNAMAYTLMVGGSATTVNEARDYLFSGGADEINLDPAYLASETMWNVLAATVFANKYNTEKVWQSGDLVGTAVDTLAPPLGVYAGAFSDFIKFVSGNTVDDVGDYKAAAALPVLGQQIHTWFGDDREVRAEKSAKE